MALGGNFVTIDSILNKLKRNTKTVVDEEDALSWVLEVLEMIAPQEMLQPMLTDGNAAEGHRDPIPVSNYRAKLPCDLVIFKHAFEESSFKQLRASFGTSHRVNTPDTVTNVYKPDFWYNAQFNNGNFVGGAPSASYPPAIDISVPSVNRNGTISGGELRPFREGTYQLKKGYIYTDFPEGKLIVSYLGWPLDENENLLIPADIKVQQAMVSYIQHKMDYQLWRSGDISDKVYNDSEQNALWDVPAAGTHAIMPSEDQMESLSNFVKQTVVKDNYFQTHFTSMGRPDKFRTHG